MHPIEWRVYSDGEKAARENEGISHSTAVDGLLQGRMSRSVVEERAGLH